MSFEEPTQRLSTPSKDSARTTTALPRPLDLAGRDESSPGSPNDTNELSLDEIFAEAGPSAPTAAASTAEAPTWTAMPVIPVRSEPLANPPAAAAQPRITQTDTKRTGPAPGERLRADAAAAWSAARRRSEAWLKRDDNGLMLMTAIVAIVLIVAVAAVG